MNLSDYRLDPLRENAEFVLFRACERRDRHAHPPSVLVVMPRSEHPQTEIVQRMEHELSLRAELNSAWAVRAIDVTQHRGRTVLVLEDAGGQPLDQMLGTPMEMLAFLRVAIGLSAAVRQLHGQGLIHKDIKPANIMTEPSTGQAWLMGFGIASRLARDRQSPDAPELIAGTLPYMAPEQTGRMNRSIDSRSDLYSLGVTLYEMLTGELPFTASDPMEWVHCHVARHPTPPGERVDGIPTATSEIISKLLCKNAEDRYQTAGGVEADLRKCLSELESEGRIDPFPLGQHDVPDRLLIPERLYGRDGDLKTLLGALNRVVADGTPELVLVSGYSGIGKSSVIHELHKALVSPPALFVSGKFDQYKRDIPYATLAQALEQLVRSTLVLSEPELDSWRAEIRQALGLNGQLIVDLVPELEIIIGQQPPVPDLPPQMAKGRFQLVFRRFIGVFARSERPLALFLDDLQWLDAATLDLFELLVTDPELRHLLLIGAYRDNEVDSAHPLMRRLEAICEAGAKVHQIVLAPLGLDDLSQLIADSLHCQRASARPLAELVEAKTRGNPFFAIQFITALSEQELIKFDREIQSWTWDLEGILAKNYTDNVVDLIIGKLNRLSNATQDVLKQLACLGNSAQSDRLTFISGIAEEEVDAELSDAVRTELVFRRGAAYAFLHDRVREAVYSLIPERLRPDMHLRIGRLLLAHTPPAQREETVFEIVNQLNRGAELIRAREEREELAELNLIAGQRAKSSAAYTSALTYLIAGSEVLPEDRWDCRHDLAFALELNRAECEFVTAQLGPAEQRLAALATRAATLVERAAVTALRVDLYTTLGQPDRAIAVGLSNLEAVGIEWPPHPGEEEARREYESIWSRLGKRAIEDLIDLPILKDPASLATLDILTKLASPALVLDRNVHALVNCRAVNLSLELGNCDASCHAYVSVAIIAGARFGDYQAGHRFGRLACELAEQRGWQRLQPRAYSLFGGLVAPWTRPLKSSRDLLRRAIDVGNSIGDVIYAAGAGQTLTTNMLMAGDHLVDVEREAQRVFEFARKARFGLMSDMVAAGLGLARMLLGRTQQFGRFDDETFQETLAERRFADSPNLGVAECFYWIRKLQARFLAGDAAAALLASQQAERLLRISESTLEEAEYHFYSVLSRTACWDSVSTDEHPRYLEALATHQRQIESWAQNCPETFENRARLVDAEIARIEGRIVDAEKLYKQAIHSAHANGFVHNEALAYETAARFYDARGFDEIADKYLRKARYCYARWGAAGKVKQLERLYPQIKEEKLALGRTGTIVASAELLDLATVIKVSQAVSAERDLDKLIDTVMRAAIEHAGAARGLLILSHGDGQRIEAEATTVGDEVTLERKEAALDSVPHSIVNYVVRTREFVILDDASSQNRFATDTYFSQHHVRSVLCLPLMAQGNLIGLLYLENSLAPNVFTPDRIAVLKLLASQAAISVENARLYDDLRRREAKIRRLVDANVVGIVVGELEGRILEANDAFLRLVGYDREDLASGRLSWRNLTPAECRGRDERAIAELQANGVFQPFEKEYFRKDGSRVPTLQGGALFEDSGNKGVAFILDLSEQKRAEAEIRALKDQLYKENLALRDEVDRASMFEEIVGTSAALQGVLSRIIKVAPTDSTVFITGETGTGKELMARAVHKRSHRSGRAFVSVNCAGLPPSLISSELFGHERGAFTGATERRLGRFELADGGTIFLDEVGELPLDTQVVLLRVLQEREFERVGGAQSIRVDLRVIAATNRDLKAATADGTFRLDLFYRLNVFPIEVPPLRERKDDILMLLEYFVKRYASRAGKHIQSIDKKTLELFQAYSWPGNIRELQNVVERSVILSSGNVLSVDELWLSKDVSPAAPQVESTSPVNHAAAPWSEREIIEAALAETRGRISGPSGAAAKLAIPASTLTFKIKSLKINRNQFKFR